MRIWIISLIVAMFFMGLYATNTKKINFDVEKSDFFEYVTEDNGHFELSHVAAYYDDGTYLYLVNENICFIFNQDTEKIQATSINDISSKPIGLRESIYLDNHLNRKIENHEFKYKVEYISLDKLTMQQKSIIKLLLAVPHRYRDTIDKEIIIKITDY